jgi:hypothetical protein
LPFKCNLQRYNAASLNAGLVRSKDDVMVGPAVQVKSS